MLKFKLPDLDQKNKSKTGFYFPISLSYSKITQEKVWAVDNLWNNYAKF